MKTVSNTQVFVDTNILYYLNDITSEFGQHSLARLKENNNQLVISGQVIREFSNVTLRNAIYQKQNLAESINKVTQSITAFYNSFEVLYESEATMML